MKILPNAYVPLILHPLYLLVFVASSTVLVLRWSLEDAILYENQFESDNFKPMVAILQRDPNKTCLANLKQVQHELRSRTLVKCGLESISTESQCNAWFRNNTQFYSQNASHQRLQNCQRYLSEFPNVATIPVRAIY